MTDTDDTETDVEAGAFGHIKLLEQVVADHGEVHVVIEEHDAWEHGTELEVRQGTATFDYEHETLVVEGADTTHFVLMDRIVRYYPPTEATH